MITIAYDESEPMPASLVELIHRILRQQANKAVKFVDNRTNFVPSIQFSKGKIVIQTNLNLAFLDDPKAHEHASRVFIRHEFAGETTDFRLVRSSGHLSLQAIQLV